jgi:hypothetical protein
MDSLLDEAAELMLLINRELVQKNKGKKSLS